MNAALLAKLIEAGTPAELVAEVALELGRAHAATELVEKRRAKDRERKAVPRNSTESVEPLEKGSLEVSPAPPPKTSKNLAPLNPPKSRVKKAVSVQAPEWMPIEPWLAFVAMRERMATGRKPVDWSEDAAKLVISKIATLRSEGHCPAKLLNKAVVSAWRTVFPDDDTKAPKGAGQSTKSAAEWREQAEWYVRRGMQDNAEDCRRKAIALETRQAA